MKIGYLVNTYPRASHSFIRREILALERMGWQVHRLAMRSDRATLVDPGDIAEDSKTEHVLEAGLWPIAKSSVGWMVRRPRRTLRALALALRCGLAGGGILRNLIYLAEAAHVARRCRDLDLRHLHAHFGTNSANVAMLAAVLGGPGYSVTVHGPEEFDAPAAQSLGEKCTRADFAVAISSFGRSQLCRWTPLEHWARLHVVHCGIEPWRFSEAPPMPTGGPLLVAIGRMAEQKGFNLLIEAMAIAAPNLPELHLTLVGDGPMRTMLEAQIARLGIGKRITLTGWLDEVGVRDRLAHAQALILPSFAEGLPMVAMEAMASARPVIGTFVAGVPELVTPDTGWLVPAGNAEELAGAIRKMAETSHHDLAMMGLQARQRALTRHDIDRSAERLTELIASRGRG